MEILHVKGVTMEISVFNSRNGKTKFRVKHTILCYDAFMGLENITAAHSLVGQSKATLMTTELDSSVTKRQPNECVHTDTRVACCCLTSTSH